ncbi:MAG: hypothetical protein IKT08_07990 [Bacteroidales bacterium]|nr:hypothetical protein [Bacteroidales bacterium]
MERMEGMYKKDDHIVFKTKQPHVHLNRMFGYNNLTEDDFEACEYKGVILDVIDNGYFKVFSVKTLSPLDGFFCITTEYEILRQIDISEVEDERKKIEKQVPHEFEEAILLFWNVRGKAISFVMLIVSVIQLVKNFFE